MSEEKISVDKDHVAKEVDRLSKSVYFQYIQAQTKTLRDRAAKYQLGFVAEKTGMKRGFSAADVFVLTCCAVIGLGISEQTLMIQTQMPGIDSHVPLAFLVGAVPALLVALCYATLASSIPRSGGDYVFVSRGFNPFLGFWASWARWFGIALAIGLIAFSTATLMADWLDLLAVPIPSYFRIIVTFAALILCSIVNLRGGRLFSWAVRASVAIFLGGGLLMIIFGITHNQSYFLDLAKSRLGADQVTFLMEKGRSLPSHNPFDFTLLLKAASVLFFAYLGLEMPIAASGEVEDPATAIPRGSVVAMIFVTVYYFTYSASLYHFLPWEFVSGYLSTNPTTNPITLYGLTLPHYVAVLLAFSLIIAVVSDIFPWMLGASRIVFAWAFDGLFPRRFAKLNDRGIPSQALILTYAVSTLVALGCYFSGYLFTIDLATLSILWTYLLVSMTVLSVSFEKPMLLKNARFRLGKLAIPIALVAFLMSLILFGGVIVSSWRSFLVFSAWSMVGLGVYRFMYQRRLNENVDMEATFALIPPE